MLYFVNKYKEAKMYKALWTLTLVSALINTALATEKILDKSKFSELKKMNIVLQDPVISIEGAIEKPESYILKLVAKSPQGSQLITAFLNKKTSELYIGSAYDKEGVPILFPKDGTVIKEGVSFTYGTGSKEIYLVTDPECPYCTKFAQAAKGQMADYTVHVIFFPLSFHKNSPAMIEWIMQGKDDAEKKKRYDEIMLKGSTKYSVLHKDETKPFFYSTELQEKIDKGEKANLELNVRGTPMLFDEKFNPLSMDQVIKVPKK